MRQLLCILLLSLCISRAASAELIELVDGSKLSGTIVHFFEGVYTIDTPESGRVKLAKEKIRKIVFELPPPRAELSTPEKTFQYWKKAMETGELEKAVDCYAFVYQGMILAQLSEAGVEALKSMQEELGKSKFTIKNSTQKDNNATLKISRTYGDDVETIEISFVKENGEWKMKP